MVEIQAAINTATDALKGGAPNTRDTLEELYQVLNTAVGGKYTKPGGGIPESDLSADVQALLALAASAVQPGGPEGVAVAAQEHIVGGPTTPYVLVHNMNTRNIAVTVRRIADPQDEVFVRNELVDGNEPNAVQIMPDEPWDTNEFRVLITGYVGISDTTAPTAPTVALASKTTTTISVTVSGSTDAVGVTGYRFFLNGVYHGSSATAGYTYSGLTQSTNYTLTAVAVDAAGNESAVSTGLVVQTNTVVSVSFIREANNRNAGSGVTTAACSVLVDGTDPGVLAWVSCSHLSWINDAYDTLQVVSNLDGQLTRLAGGAANTPAVRVGPSGQKQGSLTPFGRTTSQGLSPGTHILTATVAKAGYSISQVIIQSNVLSNVGGFSTPQVQDPAAIGTINFAVTGAVAGERVCVAHITNEALSGYNRTPRYSGGGNVQGHGDYLTTVDLDGLTTLSFTDTNDGHRNSSCAVIVSRLGA